MTGKKRSRKEGGGAGGGAGAGATGAAAKRMASTEAKRARASAAAASDESDGEHYEEVRVCLWEGSGPIVPMGGWVGGVSSQFKTGRARHRMYVNAPALISCLGLGWLGPIDPAD